MDKQVDYTYRHDSAAVIGPYMEECLARGEAVTLQISGDSMRPTLKPGRDAAILEPIGDAPIHRGDILLFTSLRSPSGYSVHRVIRVNGDTLTMNGDAQNWTEDIQRDAVLARAIALLRRGEPMNVDGVFYRLYVTLWGITRPIRFKMFALWRGIKGVLGRK